MNLKEKIEASIAKFMPDLHGLRVLTEAATGNYVVTPVIAAICGAEVTALTKKSRYGTVADVKRQTRTLAKLFRVNEKIRVVTDLDDVDLSRIDILTNTGFLRPIRKSLIDKLSPTCVLPLMWEPWEFRPDEIDIDACVEKGIKVYGTNESDPRLQTMKYLGYVVLHLLLCEKLSPLSSKVLLLGDEKIGKSIYHVLESNTYDIDWISRYEKRTIAVDGYDAIVVAEHVNPRLLIGDGAWIDPAEIRTGAKIIHIAGAVRADKSFINIIPARPAKFGHMSFTADYIDNTAVIDLHTAGLKVGEGMIAMNKLNLSPRQYKDRMEKHYPALAFADEKYW